MNATLNRVSAWLCNGLAILLIAAVLLNVFNIGARYFFNYSLLGSEELQIFAMVTIAFLGAICVSAERQHLRMDVVLQLLSPRWRQRLAIVESVLTIAICSLMTWISWQFVMRLVRLGQRSGMAEVPMWIPHLTVTLSFVCMALLAALRLPALLRRGPGGDYS